MNKNVYEEYFDSIFKYSNAFSKEEYEEHSIFYETNYSPLLPKDRSCKILDIGCGTGHFLYFLSKKGYTDFLGIDISEQQVDFCRKNVSQNAEIKDVFEFLKDKPGSFDAITANDLIEHIPKDDITGLLNLINKALRPKGVLLIKTVNLGNPFGIYGRYKDFTHTIGFTEKSLYQVLWLSGFREIKILPNKENGIFRNLMGNSIRFILSKLFWYQGFSAPQILSPLLIGMGKK